MRFEPRPNLPVFRPSHLLPAAVLAVGLSLLPNWGVAQPGDAQNSQPAPTANSSAAHTGPSYDAEGQLLLPKDYKQWTFVGSSLGMGYSEGRGGMEMFNHVLMEPTAYTHFTETGEVRDGTMFVLLLHGLGEGVLPQRRGKFAAEIHGVEMAVKDTARFDGGWAYFGFGGMGGAPRDRAEAFPAEACQACHAEHGAHDNVFLQFYPLLSDAAPEDSPARVALAAHAAE